MESIIPMTAGLLLDICGSYLILQEFLHYVDNGTRSYHMMDNHRDEYYKITLLQYTNNNISLQSVAPSTLSHNVASMALQSVISNTMRFGFIFLASGFFLILIASWINYLNT